MPRGEQPPPGPSHGVFAVFTTSNTPPSPANHQRGQDFPLSALQPAHAAGTALCHTEGPGRALRVPRPRVHPLRVAPAGQHAQTSHQVGVGSQRGVLPPLHSPF